VIDGLLRVVATYAPQTAEPLLSAPRGLNRHADANLKAVWSRACVTCSKTAV